MSILVKKFRFKQRLGNTRKEQTKKDLCRLRVVLFFYAKLLHAKPISVSTQVAIKKEVSPRKKNDVLCRLVPIPY